MKKSAFAVVAVLSLMPAGVACAEFDALKALGKGAGQSVAEGAKENLLGAITKKLKRVQNEKGPIKFKTGKAEIELRARKP